MSIDEAEAIEAKYRKKWADEERRTFFSKMERKHRSRRSSDY